MITIMSSDEEILSTFPTLSILRPHLKHEEFLATVRRMQNSIGYTIVAGIEDGAVQAVGGFRINECLAYGRHLYLDDLVTAESVRSNGWGSKLVAWLETHAKSNHCLELHLDSGVQRFGAHRFYLRERFDIVFYHFAKKLK